MSKIQYQQLLNEMTKKIEHKEWNVESKLPTINELASQYNVGVSTIREVFRTLESKGYINIQQGRGTFVSYDGSMQFTNVSRSTFMKLLKLMEFRLMIEPLFADTAAKRASNHEIEMITESSEIMSKLAEDHKSTDDEDFRFHRLIVESTHNEYSVKSYLDIQEELKHLRIYTKSPGMIEKAVHYHKMIAKSIANRDSESAKMYMESHMDATNSELAMFVLSEINIEDDV
ncbi:FadR family transcriptional regulator [Salibacterium salarium]|uniref:FadR family transcriptional regulator n=1 Tax=Salibacterium salarium TaxID=284579 RepID=A0A3R9PL05_9BACI|nr:FCD domain-containing protein [Salibacterium salarium]RSL33134.1 FadR family transcriptional regulator [Salibacterium salarium]